MKLITVSTGLAKGKTSTMYRLGAAEYKKGDSVLVIYEEHIYSLVNFMSEIKNFVEVTEFAITMSCMDFFHLTTSDMGLTLTEYFETHGYGQKFDLILVDGLYDTNYLQCLKPLLKNEESTVIMTINVNV